MDARKRKTAGEKGDESDPGAHSQCETQSTGENSSSTARARRARRLRLNRESAKERRKKRKHHVETMEKKVRDLCAMSNAYRMVNDRLQAQVNELRTELAVAHHSIRQLSSQPKVPASQDLFRHHQLSSQQMTNYGSHLDIQRLLPQSLALADNGRIPRRSPDWFANDALPHLTPDTRPIQQVANSAASLPQSLQSMQSIPQYLTHGTRHPEITARTRDAQVARAALEQGFAENFRREGAQDDRIELVQSAGQLIDAQYLASLLDQSLQVNQQQSLAAGPGTARAIGRHGAGANGRTLPATLLGGGCAISNLTHESTQLPHGIVQNSDTDATQSLGIRKKSRQFGWEHVRPDTMSQNEEHKQSPSPSVHDEAGVNILPPRRGAGAPAGAAATLLSSLSSSSRLVGAGRPDPHQSSSSTAASGGGGGIIDALRRRSKPGDLQLAKKKPPPPS